MKKGRFLEESGKKIEERSKEHYTQAIGTYVGELCDNKH
jgi:hypothetical protein